MRINPDNAKVRYSGRIDWTDPKEPIWVYPCTSAEFKFTGRYLKIFLKNKNEPELFTKQCHLQKPIHESLNLIHAATTNHFLLTKGYSSPVSEF